MGHTSSTSPSGITIVTEHIPTVRSVALGMWIAVGSRDETEAEHGCSHFLEHLLFKGTAKRSARGIAEALDAVGGELNAFTSKEVTCFHARVLDRDLPLAFDVIADMLVAAVNRPDDVESERDVVLSELDAHNDTPDDLVHTDLCELVFGGHPLAAETLGTFDSIQGLDREVIHRYYLSRYRPELITIAVAGNAEHGEVTALVDAFLGDLGRPGGRRPVRSSPSSFGDGEVRVRHRPTEQAHLALGTSGLSQRDDERWALRVLDTLLGGGMSSRLFQKIREERGLAYDAFSYAGSFSDAGVFGAYVGTAPGKVDEVLSLVRHELDHVAGTATTAEVERAKGSLAGGLVLGLEDTGSRMSRIGHQMAAGVDVVTVDESLRRISRVDVDAVRDVASRVLSRPRNLAVVGPFDAGERERFIGAVR